MMHLYSKDFLQTAEKCERIVENLRKYALSKNVVVCDATFL